MGRSSTTPRRLDRGDIDAAWRKALDLWGAEIRLSPPDPWEGSSARDHWRGDEPLAFIDLASRQVVVNLGLVERYGIHASLKAILAHEIGHHVRFPHTTTLAARLEVMEKRLLPGLSSSLLNLFFDLQVNEVVGRAWAQELATVYAAFNAERDGEMGSIYAFYLAIYESLWGLPAGALIDPATHKAMEARWPGWRGEARMFAQTFWDLGDPFTQLAYFCGRFGRYLEDEAAKATTPRIPMGADVVLASAEDLAGAMGADPRVDAAIEEATRRGWILGGSDDSEDAFTLIDRLSRAGHGRGAAEFREVLAEAAYRRLADRHLIDALPEPPDQAPERRIPTTLVDWQLGEDPREIDWIASVMHRGALAAAMPLRRELDPDEPPSFDRGFPSVELYLDTSGSMPNPARALNAMTLAAQILSASALRRGGRVRAVIYSDGEPLISPWMYDETFARRFLLRFAGGGTRFPFHVLDAHVADCAEVVRVVISDDGFIYDLKRREGPPSLAGAIEGSLRVVVMLALWSPTGGPGPALTKLAADPRLRLVLVRDVAQLGAAAGELARALMGG